MSQSGLLASLFGSRGERRRQREFEALAQAIGKAQAVIEFNLDGTIVTANANFLSATGYSLGEIQGKHHRMFVEPAYAESEEYRRFWERLRSGQYDAQRYQRLAKGGREIWIQASYNPLLDEQGKPYKVVKFATDVTEQVRTAQALDAAVKETEETIQAVLAGVSDRRIATAGKSGQLASLAHGVNGLIDSVLAAVTETRGAVDAAIAGDLTRKISLGGKSGHFLALSQSVNALIENMMGVVAELRGNATEVRAGAEEISRGNSNLSQRTEEQAANLEETASSMEEMTSTIKQNADNAARAKQLAAAASDQAVKGGAVVNEAIAAMKDINAASTKISDIIGVIDEIAFQTNLLALNAAVEAARAGEQGRGFAVVASEVRNLASRSAEAAKEIKALIQDSVAKVGQGSKLVDQSGATLHGIVSAVQKLSDIVSEISAASAEQASGIEQVNKAVTNMDEMTQQNAALVEEAAAAAESLMDRASSLTELMARYTLNDATHATRAVSRPEPRVAAPAATAAKPSAGAERRHTGRPWSKAAAAKPAAAKAPAKAVAAGNGASNDATKSVPDGELWTDF
jgi:methyl-accepting chemotaxis protein